MLKPVHKSIPYSIKTADSFVARLKGLMFQKTPLHQEGLWITPCNSIHMFFMRFPIDVVFLNKERQVVKLVEKLQPWKIISPVGNAHSTLELPAGAITQIGLQLEDYIDLENKKAIRK